MGRQRILVTQGTLGSSINRITIVGAPEGGAEQVMKGLISDKISNTAVLYTSQYIKNLPEKQRNTRNKIIKISLI